MLVRNDTVERQEAYVRKLNESGFDYGLVVSEAFVRGMRDIGYRSSATAIDEIIDNSIEAGAENVMVVFGYDGANSKKPQRIAIIDDGHGMSPGMLRAAVLWGGGHRQDSRELFGRYGFGLPSACVSQGKRFEVHSRQDGTELYSVAIDLTEIEDGTFFRENGRLAAPPAKPSKLPEWVEKHIKDRLGKAGLKHGTIVIMEQLDKLDWVTTDGLERNLIQHFGVTYRKFVHRKINLYVNDKEVDPVDPLFLDETARYYGENDLRAETLPGTEFDVKDKTGGAVVGRVRVRYSYMKPGFQNVDAVISGDRNARFNIMKSNNGILVLRAGRQIEVATNCPWHTFFNIYDRNWKVEVDFDPSLDEEFSITTSKQQVVLSDRMWKLLEQHGVKRVMGTLGSRFKEDLAAAKQLQENPGKNQKRPSEEIMVAAMGYKGPQPALTPDENAQRESRLRREIEEHSIRTGKPKEIAKEEVQGELMAKPYEIRFERAYEAPFYRVEAVGSQVRITVNQSHPFYTDLYSGPESSPRLRAALELMLFVMGECELDATKERRLFYQSERQQWSYRFNTVLQLLEGRDPVTDVASAKAEQSEAETESTAHITRDLVPA
jgi:hypothetical protein